MKLSKIIKKGIMMVLFVFLSLNFPNTHVNVQASVEAKEVIEQQLFGKDGKTSIDVSQYQLNKTETKQIVTELQKDYGTIGLMECTYQTDESGSVQTIKVQTDESLKSVISEINEIEEKTDADDSQSIIQYMKDYDTSFRILKEPLMVVGIGAAFAKNDDRGICEQMNQKLEEMHKDGTSLKIIKKYMDDPEKYLEVDDLGY